ncbi:crAss001_48 related protein [Levilactobacillus namurensis]|uniref:crAss001_48 related protein n=1 Tax=Levilactobacillus namurensis TaxID=380393 RepID=UPI0011B22344|nr:hypothetical protein [Levilactobacillus namurensis]
MIDDIETVYWDLRKEREDVYTKRNDLVTFLMNHGDEVSPDQQSYMHQQASAMNAYVNALTGRIEDLENQL